MTTDKPFSKWKQFKLYRKYRQEAITRHNIHSPFVYKFADEVLRRTSRAKSYKIEKERKRLRQSDQQIDFQDFGKSGTLFLKNVKDIARNSLKQKKYARLLGRMCQFYQAKRVLELGTSLGITTSYLASFSKEVTTLEGSEKVAEIAKSVWAQLGLTNIKCIVGDFEVTLDQVTNESYDIVFIDGNHHYKPTMRYFERLKAKAPKNTVYVFDDINWSVEMQRVWTDIKALPDVTVTIDLFALGIVFLNPDLSKQDFILKY